LKNGILEEWKNKIMEEWNDGMLECWVKSKGKFLYSFFAFLNPLFHSSIIPTFQCCLIPSFHYSRLWVWGNYA